MVTCLCDKLGEPAAKLTVCSIASITDDGICRWDVRRSGRQARSLRWFRGRGCRAVGVRLGCRGRCCAWRGAEGGDGSVKTGGSHGDGVARRVEDNGVGGPEDGSGLPGFAPRVDDLNE